MDIKSMTGYGKAEQLINNKKIIVEIRSLNSKQIDISFKSPQIYKALEMDIRKLISTELLRGKADIVLSTESVDSVDSTAVVFNDSAFKAYFKSISKSVKDVGLDINQQNIVPAILRLPEVFAANDNELSEEEKEVIMFCCANAVKALNTFRNVEGEALMNDIISRVSIIEQRLDDIKEYENGRLDKVKSDIEDNLNKLDLAHGIDKNRFEQELIYYLEKMDITEEKTRLLQHCRFFKQTVETEAMPGRKLGFIAQEFGREINTIGSKAGDADMQKLVVEMKDELEKIKEQLLNIL